MATHPSSAVPPSDRRGTIRPFLHPLHALLLAFPVALFTGAVASDIAYLQTAQIQWSNFSAWLIAFALVFGAPVLLWAIVAAIAHRKSPVGRRAFVYPALLAGMWVLGLLDAFQHSHDGWSSVGAAGLILSLLSAGLALVAGWIAHDMVREIAR